MQRPLMQLAAWRRGFSVAMNDERGPLVGSYAIANAIGLGFLLLVHLAPPAVVVESPLAKSAPITVRELIQLPDQADFPRAAAAIPTGPRTGRERANRSADAPSAVGSAFTRAGFAGIADLRKILGGVDVRATRSVGGAAEKAIMGSGVTNASVSTPGRGGIGALSGRGDGIGNVDVTPGVTRAIVTIVPPTRVAANQDQRGRGTAELSTYVRERASTLEFCYVDRGLAANPQLAGAITVEIGVSAGGAVTQASVTRRTWSGAGATAAEACILRAVRGWSFPGGGPATYSLPFSFTR